MKPRLYYSLFGILSILSVLFASISVAYFSSIMFFWFKVNLADTMAWGARSNLDEAIASFPWAVMAIALVMLVLSIALIRSQGRMYRHKTSSIVMVIIIVSIIFGYALSVFNIGELQVTGQNNNGYHQDY